MASLETKAHTSPTTPWDEVRLTWAQWRHLESRLSVEERLTLDSLRQDWVRAAERLADPPPDTDPLESDLYDHLLEAAAEAESDFLNFVLALRRVHGL